MTSFAFNLHRGFLESASRFPERAAVELSGKACSYRSLYEKAIEVGAALKQAAAPGYNALTGICASRSEIGYSGVLGALFRGHGYVPLNPEFPAIRNSSIVERTHCGEIVADATGEEHLKKFLGSVSHPLVIALPHRSDADDLRSQWPRHDFLTAKEIRRATRWSPAPVNPDSVAYVLFTSGSTGQAKGVIVSHRAASSMVEILSQRYRLSESDRLSQFADLTWDPSVVDMFLGWKHGACVCSPPKKQILDPDRFISDSRLTMIHMVPSIAIGMRRMGRLKAERYPLLRYVLMGGEPLPMEVALALSIAAPNAAIDNIYGATEYCIFSVYRWDRTHSPEECYLGWGPLGEPLPGGEALIVDDGPEGSGDRGRRRTSYQWAAIIQWVLGRFKAHAPVSGLCR